MQEAEPSEDACSGDALTAPESSSGSSSSSSSSGDRDDRSSDLSMAMEQKAGRTMAVGGALGGGRL